MFHLFCSFWSIFVYKIIFVKTHTFNLYVSRDTIKKRKTCKNIYFLRFTTFNFVDIKIYSLAEQQNKNKINIMKI